MRIAEVEIYSDASNSAVMRHPGRSFPGTLVQGDTLYSLYQQCLKASAALEAGNVEVAQEQIEELRDALGGRLKHYKQTLVEHGIGLPFYDAGT